MCGAAARVNLGVATCQLQRSPRAYGQPSAQWTNLTSNRMEAGSLSQEGGEKSSHAWSNDDGICLSRACRLYIHITYLLAREP